MKNDEKLKNLISEIFGGKESYDFNFIGQKEEAPGFLYAKYEFETPKIDTLPDNMDDKSGVSSKLRYESGTEYEISIKPFHNFKEYKPWNDDYGKKPPIRVDFGPNSITPTEKTDEHRTIKVINTVVSCIKHFVENNKDKINRLAIFAQVNFDEDVDSKLESKRGKIYEYIVRNSRFVESYEYRNSIGGEDYILVNLKD